MDEPLHPSSLSEILDRTAQIYRSRFLVFLGIAVIPTAALLVFAGGAVLSAMRWAWRGTSAPSAASIVFALAWLAGLIFILFPVLVSVSALATAAMNHAASLALLGQSTTIRGSYKAVWRRGWRYVGLYVFELVAIWMIPIAAWSSLVVLSAGLAVLTQSAGLGGGGLFVLAGFLIVAGLVIYGFWMALRLSLAFPACVVEQIGIWAAVRRSSVLTLGTKGRILLLYLLGAALNWLLSMAITIPLTIVMALLPGSSNPQHAQTAGMIMMFVVYGTAFAVQTLTRPIYGIALILFYYDQRIRQEGFDIEWMMLKAGLVVPPLPHPEAQPLLPSVSGMDNSPAAEIAPTGSAKAPTEPDPGREPEPSAPEPSPGGDPPAVG
jgi:hypothetical protein